MTHEEATMFVRVIVGMYGPQAAKMPPAILDDMPIGYQLALADVTADDATMALQRHSRSSRFIPTPAEIREEVTAMRLGPRRIGIDAWGDVLIARASGGRPDVDWEFLDPIVASTVKRMVWKSLVETENEAADRARFVELYDNASREARREAVIATPPPARTLPTAQPPRELPPGRKGSR